MQEQLNHRSMQMYHYENHSCKILIGEHRCYRRLKLAVRPGYIVPESTTMSCPVIDRLSGAKRNRIVEATDCTSVAVPSDVR